MSGTYPAQSNPGFVDLTPPSSQRGISASDLNNAFSSKLDASGDASAVVVKASSNALPLSLAARFTNLLTVLDFGAKGDGVTDDTAAINAAYAAVGSSSGGTINWPSLSFKTSGPILVYSNTKTVFAPGCAILPVAGANFVKLSGPTTALGQVWALFTNVNYNATSITDVNIQFEGPIKMQGGAFNGHGIIMRMARNISVREARSDSLQSCTAMVACKDTLVTDCYTTNCQNAAYDHWEGTTNYTVAFCFVNGSQWGCCSTASNADTSVGKPNNDGLFFGNKVFNCSQAAIIGNCLNQNGSQSNLRIIGNYIDQTGGMPSGNIYYNGIEISGNAAGCVIDSNILQNCYGTPITFQNETNNSITTTPSRCCLTNNILEQCNPSAAAILAIGAYMYVTGNKQVQGSAPIGIQVSDPTSYIGPNDMSVSTTYLANQTQAGVQTVPALQFRADAVAGFQMTGRAVTVDSLQVGALSGSPIIVTNTRAPTTSDLQPVSSLWIRTTGASAGNRLYVSQGAGSWIAISGV